MARARARARRFSRLPNFAGGNAKVRWSLSSSIASFTVLELPANHLKLSGLLKTKYWKHLYVAVYILKGQVDFQTLLIIFTLYTTVYDPHPKFYALFEFCISFSKFSSPEKHCMLFNACLHFFFALGPKVKHGFRGQDPMHTVRRPWNLLNTLFHIPKGNLASTLWGAS